MTLKINIRIPIINISSYVDNTFKIFTYTYTFLKLIFLYIKSKMINPNLLLDTLRINKIKSNQMYWNFINDLKPRTFKYKNKGELPETFKGYKKDSTEVFKFSTTEHGFIAQEVKTAIDNHSEIKDGFKMWSERESGQQELAEAALIPILVKALQEADDKIDALITRIEALES